MRIFIAALGIGCGAASAQCNNQVINWAFQTTFGRAASATECNLNRFAGGAYGDYNRLLNYVRASVVCQDPWIAEAFYDLGYQLNGHSPLQMESRGAYSTMGQCNSTNYLGARGGWSSYAELKSNITRYFSPVANQPVAAPRPSAAITGPATITSGQTTTVTWSYATPSACAQGVQVLLNGGQWGPVARAADRSVTIAASNFAYPPGTRLSLALFDHCLQTVISPDFTSTVAAAQTFAPARSSFLVQAVINGRTETLNPFALLDYQGNLYNSDRRMIASGYYLADNGVLMSGNVLSHDGGTVVGQGGASVIAQGGGNVIAQGGGNLIGQDGAGVIAQGGGNLQVAAAPDRTIAGLRSDGYLLDRWGVRILPAGSRLRIQNGLLINGDGASVIASGGGNIVMNGSGLSRMSLDPRRVADILSGRVDLAGIAINHGSNWTAPAPPASNVRPYQAAASSAPQRPFSVSIAGPATLVQGGTNSIVWTHSGTPSASLAQPNCGLSLVLTVAATAVSLAAHLNPNAPGASVTVPRRFPARSYGTLAVRDGCSGVTYATKPVTIP